MRHRLAEALAQLAAVAITVWLAPGVSSQHWWSLIVAAIAVAAVAWVLRPALAAFARRFGWVSAALTALFAQAVVLGLALWLTPGVTVGNVWWLVLASWIYGMVAAIILWLFAASADDYLIQHAARLAQHRSIPDPEVEGVLFVQLDGVPAPVLDYELRAGNLPTIGGWLRDGSHAWTEWTARVPSTTPVSQAGILHGTNDNIPAFRWYDRELGRMLVANRPADAVVIEARATNGAGLLADDGVSISNLFTGDAPNSRLTMSALGAQGREASGELAAFLTHPAGLARALTLTFGEMAKELFQARRQRRRGVTPRVHRGGAYVALRGVTNVLLRDLNVALTVEAMMQGRRSIYVDFVDYDEIAHHAGVTRPESLASLHGLDQVVGSLDAFARSGRTPRPYRIVLVSDHGQSQGATFSQRYGMSLGDFVTGHAGGAATLLGEDEQEARGRVRSLVLELGDSVAGRAVSAAVPAKGLPDALAKQAKPPAIAVVGSGNLGAVWFTDSKNRLTLADLESAHPGLIEALATHPGVGFVVVASGAGPVAIGADGVQNLRSGKVTGTDPLAGWPAQARADFARVAGFANAPDIYVNSLYEPALGEVAAFEELVGCHGGIGGWQTRPLLVHPADWTVSPDLTGASGLLEGAPDVHRQLVRWLEALGHRQDLAKMGPTSRV